MSFNYSKFVIDVLNSYRSCLKGVAREISPGVEDLVIAFAHSIEDLVKSEVTLYEISKSLKETNHDRRRLE